MNKSKRRNRIAVLIIVYVCIIALFGPPYTNKTIVAGSSYTKVAQENSLSKILYLTRRPIIKTLLFITVIGAVLISYQDYFVKRAGFESKIRRALWLANLSLGIYLIASIAIFVFMVLSFLIMKDAQSEALREFSRADFVWASGVGLLGLYCLFGLVEWRGYFSKK